ncbi:MAG: hypothetical protein Q4D88_06360 [Anaerococcus sp.]|nr:hypothetical protein [Anaerococcus sp.]
MRFVIHPGDDTWIIELGPSFCANVCDGQSVCVPYAEDYCASNGYTNVKPKKKSSRGKPTIGCHEGHLGYTPM